MKKASAIRKIAVTLSVLLLVMPLAVACAKPAPASAPKPAPAPAPAPRSSPLDAIIEGAKKEGTVTAFLSTAISAPGVLQILEKAIKDKYGVDLRINEGGPRSHAQQLTNTMMEHKTGATPTYDLMGFSTAYVPAGIKAGVFEIVDWGPLVEKGTLPEVMPQQPEVRGSIAYMSMADGLVYNPAKIPAAAAPKKMADLLDPKWQGRLGIINYPSYWAEWAFVLGKDKVLSYISSLVKMKPVLGEFPELNNRYVLGEIDLAFMNSGYIIQNRSKGMPTAFRNLDILAVRDIHLLVRKGAPHPNAAKLLAVFFTSPEGVKFLVEKTEKGTIYVPGNYMYDIYQDGLKEGLPVYKVYNYSGALDFINSPDWDKWQKEIELVVRGKG